jgi:hypothetical protein
MIQIDASGDGMWIIRDNNQHFPINTIPKKCPLCHNAIHLNHALCINYANNGGVYIRNPPNDTENLAEVFFRCPSCMRAFVGLYYHSAGDQRARSGTSLPVCLLRDTFPKNYKTHDISENIDNTSSKFNEIYKQAQIAEQLGLLEICGAGYRKALEILIKDYCINNNTTLKDKIIKSTLGTCINDYIEDKHIKEIAKRAAWLGNDETHYERIWNKKCLGDLKKLLELTIQSIEKEITYDQLAKEMPNK